MKYFFLPIFCLLSLTNFASSAQIKLQGQVINANNHLSIPFATLGIKNKSLGTVTDEFGKFSFSIPSDSVGTNELLIISSVGYSSTSILINSAINTTQTISLKPLTMDLQEVTIKPSRFKTKTFGRTSHSAFMSGNMVSERAHVSDELGKEIGTVISIDDDCQLKDFNMFVIYNHFKMIKFRLNIYTVRNNLPDTLITTQDIKFDVKGGRQMLVNVNLEKYTIFLKDREKIAVTIQWLKSELAEDVQRSFNVAATHSFNKTILFRDKSQANWLAVKGYMSFYVTANCF